MSKHPFKGKGEVAPAPKPSEEGKKPDKLGLRICADPQNIPRTVDIVFVHGLTGGREKTWRHQSTQCFWPETLLPSDIPNARIFTYGYDADVAHFASQVSRSRIGNHAEKLLASLAQKRGRTHTESRPIFFVAHSLGGLVVEDMLLHSKNSTEDLDDRDRRVLESTAGIAFMGTPHCGSQHAKLATALTSMAKLVKGLNDDIIKVLQPTSEVLARLQQEFHTMIRARIAVRKPEIRITCFFEDLATPGIGMVVPFESAILSGYRSIAIHANHENMTKFADSEDEGYRLVADELWLWIDDLNKRLDKEHVENSLTSATGRTPNTRLLTPGDSVSATYYQGDISNVDMVFQGSSIGTFNRIGS